MAQKRDVVGSGRPSGTDGSDFAHRMVVDPRYMNVAKGKSRIRALIMAQTVSQVIGLLWFFMSALHEERVKSFAIVSVTTGFISLIMGELGRRRSRVNLLQLYSKLSAASTAFSVACMTKSDMFFKVVQNQNFSALTNYELLEVGRVLIAVVLQVFVMVAATTLVQNMSPKRAS